MESVGSMTLGYILLPGLGFFIALAAFAYASMTYGLTAVAFITALTVCTFLAYRFYNAHERIERFDDRFSDERMRMACNELVRRWKSDSEERTEH